MTALAVEGLHLAYGAHEVLRGVDLAVESGQLAVVLGPSGCGKTSLLRAIAGFEAPSAGSITVGDAVVVGPGVSLPPERRRVGIVPQEGALFPHLDVAGNVAFGLPRGPGRAARVAELLAMVDLSGRERRRPAQLSGGQQQRVALARALAPAPALVLLDEPFTALDPSLREQVRAQTRRVLRDAGATAVLVTHDQAEALALADVVAVMFDGRIAQLAPPAELYRDPASLEVARFVGDAFVVDATVAGGIATTPLGPLPVRGPGEADGPASVVIRPEQVRLDRAGRGGVVREVTFLGHDALVVVESAGVEVAARIRDLDLPRPGDVVGVDVDGGVLAYAVR